MTSPALGLIERQRVRSATDASRFQSFRDVAVTSALDALALEVQCWTPKLRRLYERAVSECLRSKEHSALIAEVMRVEESGRCECGRYKARK